MSVTLHHAPRVLVVDDHELFGESLRIALEASGLEAVRAPELVSPELMLLADRFSPHVVLLDLQLGTDGDGLALIEPLCAMHAQVIVVTGVTDPAVLGACLEAGALSVVSKSAPLEILVAAVGKTLSGQSVNDPAERSVLQSALAASRRRQSELNEMYAALTRAEREVFAEMARGRSAEAIAQHRVVAVRTVRSQIEAVLAKLQVNSQLAAVALANEAGWFHDELEHHHAPTSRVRSGVPTRQTSPVRQQRRHSDTSAA